MSKFKINDRVSFYNMVICMKINGYIVKNFAYKNYPYLYMIECDYDNKYLCYNNMNRGCRFFNVKEHQIRKINE